MYPIRCFSCKKVLGNLWETYYILTQKKCIVDCYTKYTKSGKQKIVEINKLELIDKVLESYGLKDVVTPPIACDLLHLVRPCCRTVMITTVEY